MLFHFIVVVLSAAVEAEGGRAETNEAAGRVWSQQEAATRDGDTVKWLNVFLRFFLFFTCCCTLLFCCFSDRQQSFSLCSDALKKKKVSGRINYLRLNSRNKEWGAFIWQTQRPDQGQGSVSTDTLTCVFWHLLTMATLQFSHADPCDPQQLIGVLCLLFSKPCVNFNITEKQTVQGWISDGPGIKTFLSKCFHFFKKYYIFSNYYNFFLKRNVIFLKYYNFFKKYSFLTL